MEIHNTFTVASQPEAVFDALVDLERVGPCIPGATIGAAQADGSHPARIAVKLGPMRMTYAGSVRIVAQDAAERSAVLEADVRETRGQGAARATMTMDVAAGSDGDAEVASATDVRISGRAAQMGAGIIEQVAGRLVEQMAANLSAHLAAPAAGEQAAARHTGQAADAPAPAPASPPPPASRPAPSHPAPVNGVRLLLTVLAERVRRLFTKEPRR